EMFRLSPYCPRNGQSGWQRFLRPRLPHPARILSQVQSAHRPGTRAELIRLDSQALQYRNKKIRQRIVPLAIEHQVLAVLESTTRKQHRKIGRHVSGRIPEIAAVKDHRAVE